MGRRLPTAWSTHVDHDVVLRTIDIQGDASHVLGQCRRRAGSGSLSRSRRRLGRGCRRRRDDRTTRRNLCDGLRCRDCLCALSSCYRDPASDYCGSSDAEPGTRDEIASGDNRSRVLVSRLAR